MHPSHRHSLRWSLRRLVPLAAVALLAASPAVAAAEEPFPDPDGSGAVVYLNSTHLHPGDRITVRGEGFHVTDGGGGDSLISIKPYDIDPPWNYGGANAFPQGGSDSHIWFAASRPSGSHASGGFDGWIDVPRTLTPAGLAGGSDTGVHWLRILSGAFGTADGRTQPITYRIPFTVTQRLVTGLVAQGPPTAPATGTFQAGGVFRPGSPVAVRGPDWTPNAPVSATLDKGVVGQEQAITLPSPITTGADGTLPASARVPLPGTTSVGSHTLTLDTPTTGGADAASATVDVKVTKAYGAASIDLVTPTVRPGGRFAFRIRDAVGVTGAGQKVAVVVNEVTLACVTADATGSATGTAILPATTPTGDPQPASVSVGFATGTSCKGLAAQPAEVDLPGALAPKALATSAAAPVLDAAAGRAGASATLTGEGFSSTGTPTVELDGALVPSSLTVDGSGRLTGALPIPAATPTGTHTIVVTAGTTSAVALLEVAAPLVPDPTPTTPTTTTTPTVPTTPVTPTTPVGPTTPKVVAGTASSLTSRPGNRKIRLVVKGGSAVSTAVTIRSKAKVRLSSKKRAKAKIVVLARRTLTKAGTYDLTLTKDGRALLKRSKRVKVVVTVAPKGGKAVTRTLTLKRA
jgi:hypothetical protein